MTAFAGHGIPCGAVLDTAEVLADPHLRERGTCSTSTIRPAAGFR